MGTTFIPIKLSDLQEVARGCLTTIFLVDCILPPSTYYTNYEWKLLSDCDGQSHTVSCPIFTLARGSSHKIIALTLVSFFHNLHIHGFICPRRTLKGKIAKQYPEAFSSEFDILQSWRQHWQKDKLFTVNSCTFRHFSQYSSLLVLLIRSTHIRHFWKYLM
jgi:hypothetical protein